MFSNQRYKCPDCHGISFCGKIKSYGCFIIYMKGEGKQIEFFMCECVNDD